MGEGRAERLPESLVQSTPVLLELSKRHPLPKGKGGSSGSRDDVMSLRLLKFAVWALFCAGVAAAAPRRPPPVPELPGEQPTDDVPLSYADEWSPSYVPNLIDIPATELVERHHPMLELTYVSRRFGAPTYANVIQAAQSGPRFALHVRAGRDLQVSAEAPYYTPESALLAGGFDPGGAFSAFSVEVKYLVPYEVAGFRSAVGFRFMFVDDEVRPFFLPDDYQRMNMAFASLSRTPSRHLRWHAMLAAVLVPTLDGLPRGEHTLFALGVERQLFCFKHNFVRLVLEAGKPSFDDPRHGILGQLPQAEDLYGNLALRIRSGILQVDAGTRRALQSGYDEGFVTVVKRF